MKLQYARNALADLSGIIDHLAPLHPSGSENVRADIRGAVDRLRDHPFSGREQDEENVRRVLSPGYRYAIYYHVDEGADVITVLAIMHPAREQPFRST